MSLLKRAEELGIKSKPIPRRRRPQLSQDQIREFSEAFELFDTEENGILGPHETKVCIRALGFPVRKQQVEAMVRSVDQYGSGSVDLDTFLELMTELVSRADPIDEIRKAFELFDEHGTGKISLFSLRRIAKELGENLSEEELGAMIDEFDKNQDGEIDLEEFLYIMSPHTAE